MSVETKLVQVTLGALIRMEYVEVLRVPADISDDELAQLAGKRYGDVDGGAFTQDPDYWERGECYAAVVDGDAHIEVTGSLTRRDDGDLEYEDMPSESLADDSQRTVALAAIEDNAAQARALGVPKLNPYKSADGTDSSESMAFESGWYRNFGQWCDEVDKIEEARCAALNAAPGNIFMAAHAPYPREMLRLYFDEGHSAQAANDIIVGNHDSGTAEALAS